MDLRAGSYERAAALCLRGWVLSRNGHMVKLGLGRREFEVSDGDLGSPRLKLQTLAGWERCRDRDNIYVTELRGGQRTPRESKH